MHSFKQKHLEVGHTLGEQFTQAREAKQLSLTKAALLLSIQEKYLQALEQSRSSELPGEAYARSWIKKYATLLELDSEQCLQRYYQEKNIHTHIADSESHSSLTYYWHRLIAPITGPRSLQRLGIIIGAVLLIGYLIWFMIQTFQAPAVIFDQPIKDQKTTNPSMTISGHTDSGVQLWFNDKAIMVDDRGGFYQDIPLSDGLNIITIHAKKKHSREFEQTIQVVREPAPETAATSTPAL